MSDMFDTEMQRAFKASGIKRDNQYLKKTLRLMGVFLAMLVIFVFLAMVIPNLMQSSHGDRYNASVAAMREIGRALEAYNVDHGAYPPATTNPDAQTSFESRWIMSTLARANDEYLRSLTTPVPYLDSIPLDPIWAKTQYEFGYYASPQGGWVLLSPGHDGEFDIDLDILRKKWTLDAKELGERLISYRYDVTNGVTSAGDIFLLWGNDDLSDEGQ